jgi:hypothetical protein
MFLALSDLKLSVLLSRLLPIITGIFNELLSIFRLLYLAGVGASTAGDWERDALFIEGLAV